MMDEKIRLRIMIPLSLGMLALMISFLYAFYNSQDDHIDSVVQDKVMGTRHQLKLEIDQDAELMSGMLDFIEQDENIRQAWMDGGRDRLLQISLPLFEHIRSQYRVTHFYFHSIDRVNFLRVHNPGRHGDFIKRFTMAGAATTGKTVYGIELGPLGTFTLRVVRPWLIDGQLIGYIELGAEIEHVIGRLQDTLGLDFILLIEKQYIDQKKWSNGLDLMNRQESWNEYDNAAVIYRTLGISAGQLHVAHDLYHDGQENILFNSKLSENYYRSGFAPLVDAGGRNIGDIIVFYDTTSQVNSLSRVIITLLVTGILVAAALLTFFWMYLGRIENQLNSSRRKLVDAQRIQETTNQQLQESEDQYRSIIENLQDVYYRADNQGKLLLLSPSGLDLLGYDSEEDILGRNITTLYEKPDDRQLFLEALKKNGGRISNYELMFKRRDGSTFPIIVSSAVYFDKEGTPAGVEGVFSDISKWKEAEAEKEMLQTQLLHSQKLESVGQLAAGIAHEINTPAQFIGSNLDFMDEANEDISAFIEKLKEIADSSPPETGDAIRAGLEEADWEYLSEELPRAIKQSRDGIKRVSTIVLAMKEFSHPNSKEKVPQDLNHIIETTMTVARNEWRYVAEMELDLDPDLPKVPLLADEIGQVILNVLVNGAHAIAERLGGNPDEVKGTISVSTIKTGDGVELRIRDTGMGIPEQARDRIFDPFYTTKEVGKGTGQGLAISHSVVTEKHGGTIHFTTEDGKGTEFIITLPL